MNGPDPTNPSDLPGTPAGDEIDELLRARVHAAAVDTPAPEDARAELVELTPRFRRARQRRQVAVAAMSSAAAVVLVVVGAFALDRKDTDRIDTAGDDRRSTTTTAEATTSTTTSPPTTVPTTVTTAPVTTTSAVPAGAGGPGATTPAPAPTPTAPAPTPPPTTTAPVGGTQTLSATGGTATVRWTGTSITVLGTSPAAGWALEEIEQQSATRVVVEFGRDDDGSGSSSSTIDARVIDGRLDVDT